MLRFQDFDLHKDLATVSMLAPHRLEQLHSQESVFLLQTRHTGTNV